MKDSGFGHPEKGGTNADRGSSPLAPEPPEPTPQVTAACVCYLAPPSGRPPLAQRHEQAPGQAWPFPFVFRILRLNSPKSTLPYQVN